jgi:phosphohistidine phosphatase
MRTLHLLRHAKSDWHTGRPDHERPLNARGERSRALVAGHVAGWPVDLVLCSTAERARSTAEPIVEVLGCPVEYLPALYGADAAEVLALLATVDDAHREVLVVGHNPTMDDTTDLLCGDSPGFPTAALATIHLDLDHWAEIHPRSGALVALVTPADLA